MKASFDATGDVVVITGGASGIGRALALRLAEAGASAIVLDRDEEALAALSLRDPRIACIALDVADRDAVFETFQAIEKKHGKIDGLVCGAAVQPRTPIHAMAPEEWHFVQRVNLDGVVWCYQAAIGGMIARRAGSIIAFSSGLAHQGWPEASAYASTKGALIAFIKSAGKEVAPHRVRVNLVWPGVLDTAQYRQANAGADHAQWQATTGVGTPDDVVEPLMFMLSDAATMTASVLSRDYVYPARDPLAGEVS